MNKKHKLYYDIVYSELKQEAERNNIKISDDELEQQALGYLGLLQNEEDKYEAQLEKQRKENNQWFDAGAFKDGYQFGDLTKTAFNSTVDAGLNLLQGGVDIGEATGKLIVNGMADLNDQLGNHEYAEKLRYRISGQDEKTNKRLVSYHLNNFKKNFEKDSVFANKSDQIVEGAGYYAGMVSLQSIGVPWQVTAGTTSAGNELAEAYRNGATPEEARISALISATGEILSEYAFNGVKLKGTGKATDEIFGELSNRISNRLVRGLVGYGFNMMGEGFEEVLSGGISAIGKKLTYMSDKDLNEIYSKEDALDEFVSGALVTSLTNGVNPNTYQNIKEGRSLINGLTPNEQKVYNLEVQNRINQYEENNGKATGKLKSKIREQVQSDMSKGYIDIDTIESVLGDETYNRYQSIQNKRNSIKNEIEQLENMKANDMTVKQQERLQELREQYEDLDTNSIENALHSEVDNLTQNDRLLRTSYDEKVRRSQKFTVEDMNQYSDAEKEIIQKAVESGILNNTNRTHEFVNFIAKISADKGVSFEFTNNENLKNSMFAVDGKTANGFIDGNNIFLNIDSAKSLNSVVGHEITHVLEGTQIYNELQEAVKEYAESKGDYDSRFNELQELYKDIKNANIENELTADLIGDYLFTDADFINHLSATNKNLFQKIFDEIKYLYKIATTGSKEQRQLEKVKHLFEQAYNSNTKTSENVKYSIKSTKKGTKYINVDTDQNIFEGVEPKNYNKIAKMYINDYLKGETTLSNTDTAIIDSSTAKKYTNPGKKQSNFNEKMKLTPELKNVLEIAEKVDSKSKIKPNAKYSNWEYYKFQFKLDNKTFEGLLNIGIDSNNNKHLYEVNNIKKTSGISETSLNRPTGFSENTISQSNKNVKSTKYSLSSKGEMIDNKTGDKVVLEASEIQNDIPIRDEATLMAIHNLNAEKMRGILELGGFPVPSIAITNPNIVNPNQFGDISAIFGKETINPENYKNEVYDRDIWSPTFPRVNYDIDNEMLRKLIKENNIYENNEDDIINHVRLNYMYADNLSDLVDRRGIKETLNQMKSDNELKYLYLKTKNNDYKPQLKPTKYSKDYSNQALQNYIDFYNNNPFNDMSLPDFYYHYLNYGDMQLTEDQIKALKTTIRDFVYKEYKQQAENEYERKLKDNPKLKESLSKEKYVDTIVDMMLESYDNSYFKYKDFIKDASRLAEFGETESIDESATLQKASEDVNQNEFEKWIDNTFGKMLNNAKKGIRNDKDFFTASGNRRSFNQLHEEYNLKNVVDYMTKKNTIAGEEGFGSGSNVGTIQAKLSHKFESIGDIKEHQNKLSATNNQDNQKLIDAVYDDMAELNEYKKYKSEYDYFDASGYALNDFADYKEQNLTNLKKALEKNNIDSTKVPESILNKTIKDINALKDIPTDYFEAKPQRAVGLDEVQALVIPNTLDSDLKQQLKDAGLNVIEYNPNVEGDRARIINEMQQYKFSLSNKNDIAPIGNYNIYGEDIALQNQQEEIPTTDTNDVYAEFGKMLKQGIEPEENPLDYIPQDPTKESTYEIKKSENGVMDFLQNEIDRKNNKRKEAMENRQYRIPTEKSSRKTAVNTLKHMFINRNVEIDNLARDTKNPNIKYAGDMLNNISAEAQNDIYVAQTNNQGEEIGVGLDKIFKRAKVNGLYNAFNDYLLHYSNIDRHQQGKGSKVSDAESRQLVHDYEKAYPQFESWGEDVWNYGKNLRQNLLDAGLIDTELYETLGKMYPHYVPYMENANLNGLINDTGEILPRKTIKKAEGGATHEALLPVEEALTRYTYAQKKAVRQNELYQQIVNTLNDTVEIGADTRQDVSDLKENLYRDDNGNYLTAYIDGERKSVRISDELYSSLKNDMENQVKDIEKRLSLLTKPLQKASNIRRNILTSWNPTFMATNFIKDIQDAMFNSKHTKDFIKNYPSAFKELVQGKSKLVKQFTALYGSGNLMGEYQVDSGLYNGKTKQKNQKFLRRISNMNNIIELAPRYAEFKASIENGASIQEAMYNAREVTTNFSRGGVIIKALNRNGFTFLNANVQGLDKFIRNFSGENGAKGVVQSLIKATAFGVIPAVFNELAYGGFDEDKDEDYDALPDYIKDNYYLIKLGDGTFARIPKGRALSIFGSLARRTIEASEGEEDAFKGFLQNANSQIGISNPEENNLFAPLIQAKNNKAWYGGDLVPTRLQKKPTKEQYDETTDEFSKWLGDKLNVSPYKINYVLDQYSGGIGDMLLPLITEEASSGNTSAVGTALAPIKDKFVVNTTTDNKYVSEFYSKNDELQVRANSSEATDEDILRKKYMSEISSDLGKLYKEMHEVQSDTSLSKSEKYAKAQAIKEEINRLSKAGLDTYKDVRIGDTYATVSDVSYYKKSDGTWTNVSQDEVNAIESMGLTDSERDSYFSTKNSMYDINQNYKELTENATNEEKTILNQEKKVEIINSIKSANITDEAKAYLYDKQYGDTKTLEVITAIDMDMNKYLDFEAQYFKADKDSKGKTINNSKKKKVFDYINSMDISFEEKCILAKLQYNSYNEYNYDIIEYLNESEIDYETELMILQKLGFNVTEDGKISW